LSLLGIKLDRFKEFDEVYRFTYFDRQIESILSQRKTILDTDLEQELSPVLETLRKYGEIEGANFGVKPGLTDLVYELKGRTFQITYTVDSMRKEIRFYEFCQVSHLMDWKTALEQSLRSGEEKPNFIPQIGDPHKFIKAVQFIYEGINTSKDLGIAFGSSAKKDKDVVRKGNYLGLPLIELGLATRSQIRTETSSTYGLTDRGMRIALSNDLETRERLLAEALLGFYPIQIIIEETTLGGNELTKSLIQDVISLVSLGDCGGTTVPRRASSLRALVNWVTRWAGIPVRREGSDGVQLYIPNIYAS
jgi:hypothetical protein